MNKTIYEVRNVTKSYGPRCVLAVDTLDVYQGEILALVGPSGVGKSTLLRLLNFLEAPSTGTIRFHNEVIGSGHEASLALRRRVTTVFQRPLLLKRSVEANVAYGLNLRGQRNSGQAIHAALDEVGLGHMAKQSARTLSGGEAQRVALARALILRPDALLLDEPTANLDPANVALIERLVRRLNQDDGVTVVFVTHNVFQARRMGHRVALLLENRLAEVADVQTFFESPKDPRTAAFVQGDMIY
ncbi:ATP-binding cassette domain-containing protein [bacterium]|nr:ATP-binding cassette domain-containing protein [bacterium]